jgi:hypothetical protein
MKSSSVKFWVGIDLGTTNSTITTIACDGAHENRTIVKEAIAQYDHLGQWNVADIFSLPSFIYLPIPEEQEANLWKKSEHAQKHYVIGTLAAKRGGEVPERLISSAKSWLTYDLVDVNHPLLPLEAEEQEKFSLLQVIQIQLQELASAWESNHPESLLKEQKICITVPASFDPRARSTILKAAALAGYPDGIALLEEPLAALYGWLECHQQQWREKLKPGQRILVVDIGGGTSDFTLVQAVDRDGSLELDRTAVGEHLLLGGDNIDYALALVLQQRLEEKAPLNHYQVSQLLQAARIGKEKLFSNPDEKEVEIVLAGRGKKLIGGSIRTILTRELLEHIVIEGFFPLLDYQSQTDIEGIESPSEAGLSLQGLPYAQEPRITLQILSFLRKSLQPGEGVDYILLNGGTLLPKTVQDRLMHQVKHWFPEKASVIELLPGADLLHAVSHGAGYYLFSRENHTLRIKASLPKSYFIGVAEAMPTVPGFKPRLYGMVIAPKGMEEGSRLQVSPKIYQIRPGQRIEFRFFTQAIAMEVPLTIGQSIREMNLLKELPPIAVDILSSSTGAGLSPVVYVQLESYLDETGTLHLYLKEVKGECIWELCFDTRSLVSPLMGNSGQS